MRLAFSYLCLSVCICGSLLLGCGDGGVSSPAVVLYTSVDQPIAESILESFTEKTGIKIEARYDTEATKSVGLTERLRAEKGNPQCDVWWGNEIFLTIGLADDGCLAPYESPNAKDVPAKFRDPQHRWAASGMRVRVIAVPATDREPSTSIKGIEDLTADRLKDKITMARPVFGTTTGHVAALYAVWGDAKADAYFKALHVNGIKLVGGNAMVVQGVAGGQFLAGLTDNDDVDLIGGNVRAILPDQQADGLGTLAIPCTVAGVAGRPMSENTKKLIDHLLSREVEQKLIDAKFVKYSVRAGPGEIRTMDIDYAKVAEILPKATRRATALMEGREN